MNRNIGCNFQVYKTLLFTEKQLIKINDVKAPNRVNIKGMFLTNEGKNSESNILKL